MPEIRDYYVHVRDLDLPALHARADVLRAGANGDYRTLGDEALAELLAITRELRKRAAIPARGAGRKPKAEQPKTVEDLL